MNGKTIFWNVDTQYDFMRPDGKLYVPGAEELEQNLERLTNFARTKNIQTVGSVDWHNENSKEFSATPDYINTFPPHCIAGTPGAEYVPATAMKNPYIVDWDKIGFDRRDLRNAKEILIRKDAFDVFSGNPNTKIVVYALAPARAIVYGVATNFCDDYSVWGLRNEGVEVHVVVDAIKEIPLANEPQATFAKWKKLGVKFTTTEEIISKYK